MAFQRITTYNGVLGIVVIGANNEIVRTNMDVRNVNETPLTPTHSTSPRSHATSLPFSSLRAHAVALPTPQPHPLYVSPAQ